MAAPVVAAQGAFVAYSGSTSLAVPVPSGVASGSKIVAHLSFAWNTNTTPTSAAVTPPSGFTLTYGQAFTDSSDGYVMWEGWYEKTATASDTGTYTFTGNTVGSQAALALGGVALRITGAASTALGGTLQNSGTAVSGSGSFTIATYTPPQDNCLLLTWGSSFAAVASPTYPSGWTALGTVNGSGAGGLTLSDLAQTTATATGSLTWKVNSSDFAWGTMATVVPAATATNITVTPSAATGSGSAPTPTVTASSPNASVSAGTATGSGSASSPTVSVVNPTAPTITTTTLSTVRQGTAFSQTIAATGSPTSWIVDIGNLPAGLSLNADTGEITGTPTGQALTYSFTLKASNTAGYDTQSYSGSILMASESSRTTGTTSVGTAYTKVVGTLGSDGWVGYFPSDATTGLNLLLWNHPYESPYDADIAGTGDSGWTFALTSWLLDHGIAITSSNDAGDQFGTAPVMAAIDAEFGQMNDFFTIGKLAVYGESMGGSACLNWTARNNTAPLVGAMCVSGVADTSQYTSYGTWTYSAAYNPVLEAATDWADLPIFLASSPDDTTVDENTNAHAFATHVTGQAVLTTVETTGQHLTSGNYPTADMEAWWTSVFTGSMDASVSPSAATGVSDAPAPEVTATASVTTSPATATGQTDALEPGVSTVKNVSSGPDAATASALALPPSVSVAGSVVVAPNAATGTTISPAPVVQATRTVFVAPGAATASGQANQPDIAAGGSVTIGAGVAEGQALAPAPAVLVVRNVSVDALAVQANAEALVPFINPPPIVPVTSGPGIVQVPADSRIVGVRKEGRIAWL